MNKLMLLFICLGTSVLFQNLQAQDVQTYQSALNASGKKVQAIHHYPDDIQDGKCHFVEITSINISGNKITIVEEWENYSGSISKTILTGIISGNTASGKWESSYSAGEWEYNFRTNDGKWNKKDSLFGSFTSVQPLEIRIISNSALKDGFFSCK